MSIQLIQRKFLHRPSGRWQMFAKRCLSGWARESAGHASLGGSGLAIKLEDKLVTGEINDFSSPPESRGESRRNFRLGIFHSVGNLRNPKEADLHLSRQPMRLTADWLIFSKNA